MSAPKPLTKNAKRMLAKVCQSNGGGADLSYDFCAPRQLLIKLGLITLKKDRLNGERGWVHTKKGLAVYRNETDTAP